MGSVGFRVCRLSFVVQGLVESRVCGLLSVLHYVQGFVAVKAFLGARICTPGFTSIICYGPGIT